MAHIKVASDDLGHLRWRESEAVRLGALILVGVFVACAVVEHVIEPSLDPRRHMLSEYARGRAGALMTVGFACWSLSLAASAVWTSGQAARQHGGRALSALLLVSATGMAITAAFRTQTSAGTLHYGAHMATGGRLHDWGSGATSLGLLAAAALTTRLQWMEPTLRRATATLLTATLTIDVLLLAAGDQVQGIRQRLLVTAGCGWQIAFLLSPRKSRRQSED